MNTRRKTNDTGKRWRKGVIICAGVLVAALVAVIIILLNSPIKLTELPFYNTAQYGYTGAGFYYLEGSQLSYVDNKNSDKNTRQNISTSDVSLLATERITLIYTANAVRLLSADESIDISGGRVIDVECGMEYFAVLCENADKSTTLLVFNSKSEQVDSIEFSSTCAIDFGFDTSRGELLWTIDIDTSSTQSISTLTTYDLDKRTTSGVITVVNQLIDYVEFTRNSIFIVGTRQLIRYDRARNSESYRASCFGRVLYDNSLTQEKPLFIFVDNDADKIHRITLYTMTDDVVGGAQTRLITVPEDAIDVFAMRGCPVVVTPDNVYIYDIEGKLKKTKKFDSPISGATKLTDNTLLVERDGKLYTAMIMD